MGAPRFGWFETVRQRGDRTLRQQLTGLELLLAGVADKSVLDVGCAEGLIGYEVARAGASCVHGVDVVHDHIVVAREDCPKGLPCTFAVVDVSDWEPDRDFDVVLMLAVLHKLRDPTAACKAIAAHCRETCVIRLPPRDAPFIVDARSAYEPHDINAAMRESGFRFARACEGHLTEWTGYFERRQ